MTPGPTGRTGRAWAYAGAGLGGAVSVAANVAHSYVPPPLAPTNWVPEAGAVVGAVFWPVAVLVAIEVLARVPWPAGRRWVALRFAGLLPVAVVAAVVSYRHLSGLLTFYGEDTLTATIGPLAVDGLMVMATGALIATGGQAAPVTAHVTVTAPDTADIDPVDETGQATAVTTPALRSPQRTASTAGTATAVTRLATQHPDMPAAEIARRLKVSDRTVRRHLADRRAATTDVSTPHLEDLPA